MRSRIVSHPGFPKICVALGLSTVDSLVTQARHEIESGETFLEIRLDYLDHPEQGTIAIREIQTRFPDCTLLATCRRHHNHGRFDGSVEQQLQILDSAIDHGAHAADIEIETAEVARKQLPLVRARAKLIVSYHNFENTPALDPVIKRLTRLPADGYKLVTTARKPSDLERILAVGREHARIPLIAFAMGEQGFATRILSLASNALFTYAAPCAMEGTAAGQVSARILRKLYRTDRISRAAKVYCVIADPVSHSLSPVVHNRAFQLRRMDAVYVPLLVSPRHLRDFFKLADGLPLAGFSVTLPHKQKILAYLDSIDSLARRIGAVNTVWRKAGKWRGSNTDANAVVKPLAAHLRLPGSRILIAGSGGAARSAACALADAGARISITGRNYDRVRSVARFAGGEALLREKADLCYFDAVVHATPLGTYPNVNNCFFPGAIPADIVFDMVYNPLDTLLLQRAKAQGKKAIPGTKMFLEQAAAQFELWTGETAPRSAMETATLDALAARQAIPFH